MNSSDALDTPAVDECEIVGRPPSPIPSRSACSALAAVIFVPACSACVNIMIFIRKRTRQLICRKHMMRCDTLAAVAETGRAARSAADVMPCETQFIKKGSDS